MIAHSPSAQALVCSIPAVRRRAADSTTLANSPAGFPHRRANSRAALIFAFLWKLIQTGGMRSEMIRRISSASLHTRSKTRGCAFKNFQRKTKAFTTLRAPRPPKSCRSYHAGRQPSRIPAPSALVPLAHAPAGNSLKTCHWHVFLTGIHLIGSSPDSLPKGDLKRKSSIAGA